MKIGQAVRPGLMPEKNKKLRYRQENSAAVVEILKGNRKYLGASLAQGHDHFPLVVVFIVGLGQPQLHAKFEVFSFSCCTNITAEP